MIDVRTEYYFRYSGTQTTPPCYGKFVSGSRGQTNHWRVFKDPIVVTFRQVNEMHRLIRSRIAPKDDPIKSCKPDTAAIVNKVTKRVNTNRPLQKYNAAHFGVFCECPNWKSHFIEDQQWCSAFKENQTERYFDHPYNFPTKGF